MVARGISIFFGIVLVIFVIQNPDQVAQLVHLILDTAHKIATSLGGLELPAQK
jgi:Na+/alanine symporter